jgi:hypothetical protein
VSCGATVPLVLLDSRQSRGLARRVRGFPGRGKLRTGHTTGEAAMAWDVSFREDQEIVQVVVRGAAPREEHLAARAAAARLLQDRLCHRLLVDLRELETEGMVSMVGCFDFGSHYSRPDRIPAEIRVAHLLPSNPKASKDVEFMTALAVNQGAAIRNFESLEEACAWLLAPFPKEEP